MAPVEDEIFEADTSNLVEQVQITTADSDYLFKEKQNEMANNAAENANSTMLSNNGTS